MQKRILIEIRFKRQPTTFVDPCKVDFGTTTAVALTGPTGGLRWRNCVSVVTDSLHIIVVSSVLKESAL